MKGKFKFLGIIAIVAVIGFAFIACEDGDNQNPTKTYTVTFNADNGTENKTQTVSDGGKATQPTSLTKAYDIAGLYKESPEQVSFYIFSGWYKGDELFSFESPVTGNITLTAKWIAPTVQRIESVEANEISAAITYINTDPETYTLLIDNDTDLEPQLLNKANVKLTIIGIGSERKINLSRNGQMFTIGASGQTGIELTLGNNITLVGRSNNGNGNENNNDRVVHINYGNSFTMLNGSMITGNTCSVNPTSTDYLSAAVYVMGNSNFTLKGGTITGNAISDAQSSSQTVSGGIYVGTGCSVILEGGSIIGNTGVLGDVLLNPAATSFTLNKTSVVDELTINTASATASTITITIEQDWIGNVGKLNLRGGNSVMATAISYWEGRTILKGNDLTTANVDKVNLGNFISSSASNNTIAINTTHKIENDGTNIGKLVKIE